MYAVFSKFLSVLGTALVVKTMDDLVDEERLEGIPYYTFWGPALIPYTLALFSLALALDWPLSFGLFWASYGLGMVASPWEKLPTNLRAGMETALSIGLMLAVIGLQATLWSLLIIGAVQLGDDFLDYRQDEAVSSKNAALVFGQRECFLSTLILLYSALKLQPLASLFSWSLALFIGNGRMFRKKGELLWF